MKTLLFTLTALLAATSSLLAAGPFLKADVTGTVQTQIIFSPTEGRIHTSVLNNKRIFQEFGVTKTDYELVMDLSGSVSLVLLPKSASGGLSTITVAKFGNDSQVILDTKSKNIDLVTNLDAGTAANLFKALSGETHGAAHFAGTISSPIFTKFTSSVVGHGTDTSGSGGGSAFLKFKIVAKGNFVQAP